MSYPATPGPTNYQPAPGPADGWATPSPTQPSPAQPGPGQPAGRYPQLDRLIHTEEGFKRSIRYAGPIAGILSFVLAAAVLLLVYNVITTFGSLSDNKGATFWDMFMVTTGSNGTTNPMLVAMVWGPLVAIPVIVVLLVVRALTRNSSMNKVWEKFNRGGFLADLMPTNVTVSAGRTTTSLYAFGTPNVPPEWVATAAQQVHAAVSTDPKSPDAKTYTHKLNGNLGVAGVVKAANIIDPTIPAGIFLVSQAYTGPQPMIAIPAKEDLSTYRLYGFKKDVAIG